MSLRKKGVLVTVLVLAVAGTLWAQRPGRGGGMNPTMGVPSMPSLQNPTVGSGSEYQMSSKGKDMDIAMVALGKEDVDGATGFWMEMRMTSPELGGETVTKTLTVVGPNQSGVKRMIVQRPGQPPMEMPAMMMNMMQQRSSNAPAEGGKGNMGQLVGTEMVTVPAGTFNCQHYRKQEQTGTVDMWISQQVTPYAMVKMTSPDVTMLLKKVLTNETSHIKGEPQKMQMPEMPHF